MSLLDLTLDGVSLVDTVEAVSGATIIVTRATRPLSGSIRAEFIELPGRAGAYAFDEENGEVILTFDVTVLVDDIAIRRSAIAAVRQWARTPEGRKKLIVSDEAAYWDAKIPAAGVIEDDEYVGQATIVFSAGPYAFAATLSTEEVTATTNPDSDTFSISLSYEAEPVIELTPQGGNFSGFFLTVNGADIQWFGTVIGAGETITVSTISQTVTLGSNDDMELTGVFDSSDVTMANVATNGFPDLVNGVNSWSLAWNGTATSVDVVFTWRERFI